MFTNKIKNIIIPQREHARLAGNLAIHWGNKDFDLPKIPTSSVVKGITFHQNGYEILDTYPVKEMEEETLIGVFKRDFNVKMGDTEAELVNKFHQLRLVTRRLERVPSPKVEELKSSFETEIEINLKNSKYSKENYLWADRITNLCDRISFNFSFGESITETIQIFQKNDSFESAEITQTLDESNNITLDKWPFSANEIKTLVIAFQKDDYPANPTPVLLEFRLRKQ